MYPFNKTPYIILPNLKTLRTLFLDIMIVLKHFGLITITLQAEILKWINSVFLGILLVQYATQTHITESSKYSP